MSPMFPVVPLLFARGVRTEWRIWGIVFGTLVLVAFVAPSALAVTALVAAGALVLRAVSPTFQTGAEPARSAQLPSPPYRRWSGPHAASIEQGPALEPPSVVAHAERVRAFTGAFFALYLAVWTRPYTGGAWPAHVTALDATFTACVLLAVWRLRFRTPLAPLAAVYAHLVTHAMPAPRTPCDWGVALVVVGFALLLGALAVTYGFRSVAAEPSSSTTGDSA
jgi:hypothetical protein